MKPINLKTLYSKTYKIVKDESAGDGPLGQCDPRLYIIPCKYGEIYPHSNKLLSIMAVAKREIIPKLKKLGLVVHQDGDGEAVLLFPPERMKEVAKIVKPRTKRQISPEARNRLVEVGREHQFKSQKHGVQDTYRVATGLLGGEAVL